MIDDDSRLLATEAMSRTEGELLLELGAALTGPDATYKGDRIDDFRDRAVNWLARNREQMKDLVCDNPRLDSLTGDATDAAVVADLLSTLLNKPAVYSAAAIVLKRGLHFLCTD